MTTPGDEPNNTERIEDLGNRTHVRWTESELSFEHARRGSGNGAVIRPVLWLLPFGVVLAGLPWALQPGEISGVPIDLSFTGFPVPLEIVAKSIVLLFAFFIIGTITEGLHELSNVRRARLRWIQKRRGRVLRALYDHERTTWKNGPKWAAIERTKLMPGEPAREIETSLGGQGGSGAWHLRLGDGPDKPNLWSNLNIADEHAPRAAEAVGAFLGIECRVIQKTVAQREKERGLPRIVG